MRPGLLAVAVVVGCGGGGMHGPDGAGDDSNGSDGTTGDGFTELIGRDWMIGPGTFDNYKCTRIQINQEMWIAGFRALSPMGTHHEILTISDSAPQLGDYDCAGGNLDIKMLYAAAVDTGDLVFPTGVAMHIKPGQFINLNVHLFDATENPLSGHSGVLAKTIPAAQVVHEADMTFAGTTDIQIPPGQHSATGGCAIPEAWTVFALWPHMHQAAMSQTVRVNGAMALNVTPYVFDDQRN